MRTKWRPRMENDKQKNIHYKSELQLNKKYESHGAPSRTTGELAKKRGHSNGKDQLWPSSRAYDDMASPTSQGGEWGDSRNQNQSWCQQQSTLN